MTRTIDKDFYSEYDGVMKILIAVSIVGLIILFGMHIGPKNGGGGNAVTLH